MKLIAYFLPQFHQIDENDAWWGEGFTEWTNTRKNKPLYKKHAQPKEPLKDLYYNLMDASIRKWQADAARSHGIYGFCYYHYWFKGKRLLEKPFQSVLKSGEPDFPFCLSWANEPWTRKWDGGNNEILMPQDYGDENDWAEHFDELLTAFQDPRYIRVQNKPLFVIYRPGAIPRCEEMLRFWNQLALRSGLEGIYFARTLGGFEIPPQSGFEASIEFEPHYTFAHGYNANLWSYISTKDGDHLVFDYDGVWEMILNRSPHRSGETIFPGAYVNWDNTPRIGARGQSCIGSTPEKFSYYLTKQMNRAASIYQSEFLFINAWNEWAEGTYLEPDKKHHFSYLEAVQEAVTRHEKYMEANANHSKKR